MLSVIYTPQSATTCDIVTIRGSIGLRRLRVEYPLVGTCLGMTVELNPTDDD